jgi:flagellar hook-associated protein 2
MNIQATTGTLSMQKGLATGLDTGALIQQLIQVERQPAQVLEVRKSMLQMRQNALNTFAQKLESLNNAAQDMDGLSSTLLNPSANEEFLKYSSSLSDEDILKLTPQDGARPGSHTIEVKNLAKVTRLNHNGFASAITPLSSQDDSFVLKIGSQEHSISVSGSATTLTDLRNKINDLDAGVTASIVNSGEGSTPYRLVITGDKTGAANAVSIGSATTLNGFGSAGFTETQAASDATVVIDGVELKRAGNSFNDVIEGVSIELKKETEVGKPVEAKIEMNETAIKGKVENIISAFNDALSFMQAQSYSKNQKNVGALNGDYLVVSLQSRLRNMMSASVEVGGGRKLSGADIGIKTLEGGTLSLDSDKFMAALRENPQGVKMLFGEGNGVSGIAAKMSKFLDDFFDPKDGVIKGRTAAMDDTIKDIDKQMTALETRLRKREATLLQQFTNMEKAVSSIQNNQNWLNMQMLSM